MVRFSSISLALAISAIVPTAFAAPMNSCATQNNCIKFEKKLISDGVTCSAGDACEWEVCATLDMSMSGCTKSVTDTVSHSCVKPANTCSAATGFDKSLSVTNTPSLPSGHKQCQIVKGGGSVQFLFKDGSGCSGSASSSEGFSCSPRAEVVPSCSGNKPGVECIWTATVPPCPAKPPPPPPTSPTPEPPTPPSPTPDPPSHSPPTSDTTSDITSDDTEPCTAFSADKPYKHPTYVDAPFTDHIPCTYGSDKKEGSWVCRTLVDKETGDKSFFSVCVGSGHFIKSDKSGCCDDVCPEACKCHCERKSGGSGVLIQKKDDPDCLQCYAPYAAFRKIGVQEGYQCLADCV